MTKKQKHMSIEDRQIIEEGLNQGESFKQISVSTNKNCTTISKEVRNNYTEIRPSKFNGSSTCVHRKTCSSAKYCSEKCENYQDEICEAFSKPPYVCNGCDNRRYCRKIKHIYKAKEADELYRTKLVNSRTGINLTEDELTELKNIVQPAVKKGHSPAMILMNNTQIKQSEKCLYNYINKGVFDNISDIDLPRKVKYKKRSSNNQNTAQNRECRIGRTYEDFLSYIELHPNANIVEMDTVEGIKGGKCLLTLLFRNSNFMICFILESQTQEQVNNKLNLLKSLWKESFLLDFEVILTDNGKEFLDAETIEFVDSNNKIHLFYCDPGKSQQKAKIEKNHEYIRYILPKGTAFDHLTQSDIDLLMSHINSVPRKELNNHSPYELALILIGDKILLLNYSKIDGNDIILKPKLLKK